jgi:hypothetical protein
MPTILPSQRFAAATLSDWNAAQNDSALSIKPASIIASIREQLKKNQVLGIASFLSSMKQFVTPALTKAQLKKLCAMHQLKVSDMVLHQQNATMRT